MWEFCKINATCFISPITQGYKNLSRLQVTYCKIYNYYISFLVICKGGVKCFFFVLLYLLALSLTSYQKFSQSLPSLFIYNLPKIQNFYCINIFFIDESVSEHFTYYKNCCTWIGMLMSYYSHPPAEFELVQ